MWICFPQIEFWSQTKKIKRVIYYLRQQLHKHKGEYTLICARGGLRFCKPSDYLWARANNDSCFKVKLIDQGRREGSTNGFKSPNSQLLKCSV